MTYGSAQHLTFSLEIVVCKPRFLNYYCGDYPQNPSPLTELLQTRGLILGLGLTASVNFHMLKELGAISQLQIYFELFEDRVKRIKPLSEKWLYPRLPGINKQIQIDPQLYPANNHG